MSESELEIGGAPAPAPKQKGGRAPILWLFVNGFALLAALVSVVGLTAAFSRLGLWIGFVPALLLGGVLPFFLVVRAARALTRRSAPPFLRHLISLVLYVVIHAAIAGVVLDWFDRDPPDYARAAGTLLAAPFGEVPWISGILNKSAEGARIVFGEPTPDKAPPSTKPPAADGGPTPGADGGPAPSTDAGPAPTPAPSGELSPRAGGRTVLHAAYLVKTAAGDPGVLVASVKGGGEHKLELLSLAAHADLGSPTAASVASDGSAAVVVGGAGLLLRGPGERLGVVGALKRNAIIKLDGIEGQVRRVADVVAGPKGAAVAVVEIFVTEPGNAGEVRQALVSVKGAEVKKLRAAGEPLPDNDQDLVDSFLLRRPTAGDAFCVVEIFRQGGAAIPVDTSGEKFQVNPERLLCAHLDNPGALVEATRTDSATGDGREVQRFYDAFSLQDGRALVQANFVSKGRETGVFLADPRAGTRAVPGVSGGGQVEIDAEPEGHFAWRAGEALVFGELDQAAKAGRATSLNAIALGGAFTAAGQATRLRAPRVARGGDWLLVIADLAPPSGRSKPALLLASEADLAGGVAELLLTADGELGGVQLRELEPAPERVRRR